VTQGISEKAMEIIVEVYFILAITSSKKKKKLLLQSEYWKSSGCGASSPLPLYTGF
jgi:hypothetical protein